MGQKCTVFDSGTMWDIYNIDQNMLQRILFNKKKYEKKNTSFTWKFEIHKNCLNIYLLNAFHYKKTNISLNAVWKFLK